MYDRTKPLNKAELKKIIKDIDNTHQERVFKATTSLINDYLIKHRGFEEDFSLHNIMANTLGKLNLDLDVDDYTWHLLNYWNERSDIKILSVY